MIDRKVQMMDAGMGMFQTEKPFGTVIGGIKSELAKYGKVWKLNEIKEEELPPTTGDCDIFMDWSTPLRHRHISCKLEEAGLVGKTDEGEEIHRYAASFKEGNRNTTLKSTIVLACALVILVLGILGTDGVPGIVTILAALAIDVLGIIWCLRPSVKAQKLIRSLLDALKEAK